MIEVITTNFQTGLFWHKEYLPVQRNEELNPMVLVNCYENLLKQSILGFGGAFTEAGAYVLSQLDEEKQDVVMASYFSEEGLKYNLGRTHINSCDFALGNYDYTDGVDDITKFSIDRDRMYLIPMIKKAVTKKGGPITLLASPWSPPAYMKSNHQMNDGGYLLRKHYESWARYIVTYLAEYETEGILIDYLTIQNEPQARQTWDSCIYSSQEEQTFIKEALSPMLKKTGYGSVKILIWDHNKESMYDRALEVLEDDEVRECVAGVGFHWYTGEHFDGVRLVHERYPEKELIFTEGCVEFSRYDGANEIAMAEHYAHDMIGNFQAGMNGFIDWNLVLDSEGGPNHKENYCAAPIMCDTKHNRVLHKLMYYYIGHFSRYIKAGARRIETTKYCKDIEVVACKNKDGEVIVVILNLSENKREVAVKLHHDHEPLGCSLTMEPHTIKTLRFSF